MTSLALAPPASGRPSAIAEPLSLWRTFPRPKPSVLSISEAVAAARGLSLADIMAHTRRTEAVCMARFAAYAACRQAGFTYHQIARRLGRDHSSIIAGERRHYQLMEAAE